MKISRLVLCEIRHRWVSSLLTLGAVAAAVAAFVAATTLLRADEVRTDELLDARQQEVATASAELEDAMRKITKGLGFNILVLPQDQDLGELHALGTPTATMPSEHVERLANSKIVTINHLLPIVAKKLTWEETGQEIIVTGTKGEVPIAHRALKKPLLDTVPAGTLIAGAHVSGVGGQALEKGQQITLLGREFEVTQIHKERGTVDDITIWINLAEAQEMLGMQNQVNAILALECNCATEDRVAEIRGEIEGILPGTQVVERGPPALARAEARNKAKQAATENLATEEANRTAIRDQREQLASILVPIVVVIAATWIGLLTLLNVRQRREEIGILRAIGLSSGQILSVLLSKSVLVGLLGGALGAGVGFLCGVQFGDLAGVAGAAEQLFDSATMATALLAAPLLSAVAAWLPALMASQQDPATVLAGS